MRTHSRLLTLKRFQPGPKLSGLERRTNNAKAESSSLSGTILCIFELTTGLSCHYIYLYPSSSFFYSVANTKI